MAADGRFDLFFDGGDNIVTLNGNGKVLIPITSGSSNDFASTVAIRPDGMIYIVGSCWNGSNYDFCGTRLEQGGGRGMIFYGTGFNGFAQLSAPVTALPACCFQTIGKFIIGNARARCLRRTLPCRRAGSTYRSTVACSMAPTAFCRRQSLRIVAPMPARCGCQPPVSGSSNYRTEYRLLLTGKVHPGRHQFLLRDATAAG